jgi:hypothetical protein
MIERGLVADSPAANLLAVRRYDRLVKDFNGGRYKGMGKKKGLMDWYCANATR